MSHIPCLLLLLLLSTCDARITLAPLSIIAPTYTYIASHVYNITATYVVVTYTTCDAWDDVGDAVRERIVVMPGEETWMC